MDSERFDDLVRTFGQARSRRQALRGLAGAAGFGGTRVKGEELLANMYGWWLRTIESTANPDQVPHRWQLFAFRSYLALQKADTRVFEPNLPPELFYNLLLSARKPG